MEQPPAVAVPEPPTAALCLVGDALPAMRRYAALLATDAVERGLIGPREVPRLWERHLLNCAVLAGLCPPGARCVDVGSGAGLPGIVVALVQPTLRMTLLEPLLRRATFLAEAVEALDLGDRVDVDRGRAEDRAGAGYDVALARAVAPLGRLAGWCLPLLRPGGELLAMKGTNAAAELEAALPALRAVGASAWSLDTLGTEDLVVPARVVRVRRGVRTSRTTRPRGTRR